MRLKSSGPRTFRQRQPRDAMTSCGMTRAGHTMDSSSAVRVMEKKGPSAAQSGVSSSLSSRQMANSWGNRERVSMGAIVAVSADIVNPGLGLVACNRSALFFRAGVK